MGATSLREVIVEGTRTSIKGSTGLWAWLQAKVDLAQYRPQALPGAVASQLTDRNGPYVIVKNPEAKTYYRMGANDYFLWQKMDGTRTVKDLVVAYFMEFKSFAFSRVASLVLGLKQNRLLVDQPMNVYGQVYARLIQRRPRTRLLRLSSAVMGKQFAISGLDRLLSAVYRRAGWLLYTRPALILYALVSIAGLYCFFRAFRQGGYGVVQIGGSYVRGMIGLAVAYILTIFLHELSHALTVKHYGCEVRRAGFMLYVGMPGFFVDTTDIWMKGKRARLAVTWAGPYSGLILGGLAAIVMVVWPRFGLNAVLFQFAFMTYMLVFFNLNPLLELDGYYMLMDSLEIPGLRRQSLSFLRTGLSAKLKELKQAGLTARALVSSFSREERIFTVFGVLSLAWTAYAIFMAGRSYQGQIVGAVRRLFGQGTTAGQALTAAVVLLISLPILFGLAMGAWGLIRGLVQAGARRGLFRGWNRAGTLAVAAALLAILPGLTGQATWLPFLGLAALAAAAYFWSRNALHTAGSRLAPPFWLLAAVSLVLIFARALDIAQEQLWLAPALGDPLTIGLDLLAALSLAGAGMTLFAHTDLRQLAPWQKGLLALGLAASYLVVSLAVARAPAGPEAWLVAAGSLAPLLALTLALPSMISFWRSGFGPAWALLALSLAGLLLTTKAGLAPLLPYLLVAASAITFHLEYAAPAGSQGQSQPTLGLIDTQRLDNAFASAASSLWRECRGLAGDREIQAVEREFNHYALAAGWPVQIARGQVEQSLAAAVPLAQRGETYGAALTLLLDLLVHEMGDRLVVRGFLRAYDTLPWDQREVAAQVLFPHVKRAEALGKQFQSTQSSYQALLRRIPLFAAMDEGDLNLLCSRLQVERCRAGQTIILQGDRGDRFYIVARGHVEAVQRQPNGETRVVNQFDRGGYFGEVALLNDAPRNATCRATVPSELLSLTRADFDQLVKHRFALREKVGGTLGRTELLRRVPFFTDLDSYQLQLIAAQLRPESYSPGQDIIRQGEVGEAFYIIESGCTRTIVCDTQTGREQVIAERGPGEYVGEIALLMQVPRTATVRALTPVQVLALQRDDFDRLVASQLYLGRGLEQEASRRMSHLRYAAQNL